jgi:6-phosphogluconolactonase/glucosamine-6-phosphate isomerase/deaminase
MNIKIRLTGVKITFFFGDERYVPANDAQSNSLMIQKSLFDPLKISGAIYSSGRWRIAVVFR